MRDLPLTVWIDGGPDVQVFPDRTIAAVSAGHAETDIWHFDAEGLIDKVTIFAELRHVRDALGLDETD